METKSVALIVSALASVALSGTDAASPAVDDAYARLKGLVRERLGGNSDAELALARLSRLLRRGGSCSWLSLNGQREAAILLWRRQQWLSST